MNKKKNNPKIRRYKTKSEPTILEHIKAHKGLKPYTEGKYLHIGA